MKHLGDITLIDGSKIEPVDVITFGSPCQDYAEFGVIRISVSQENVPVLPVNVADFLWKPSGLLNKCRR